MNHTDYCNQREARLKKTMTKYPRIKPYQPATTFGCYWMERASQAISQKQALRRQQLFGEGEA